MRSFSLCLHVFKNLLIYLFCISKISTQNNILLTEMQFIRSVEKSKNSTILSFTDRRIQGPSEKGGKSLKTY